MLEYLSMALKSANAYSHILAITFTNKAANEIKERIVETLEKLAILNPGAVPANIQGLVDELSKRTGLAEDKLFTNASEVLTSILHNYSDFAVSTIDSFMHRIIRSFAFDLKLSMNFEVELDTNMLLDAAIEELISKVGKDEELTEILKTYVIRQAENDETWDITKSLHDCGKSLTRESMLGLIPALDTKNFTTEEYNDICAKLTAAKSQCKTLGSKAMELINNAGIDIDCFTQGKKGIGHAFFKFANGELPDISSYWHNAIDGDNWFPKKYDGYALLAPIKDDLVQIATSIEKLKPEIKLLELVVLQFHTTALLKRINQELKNLKEHRNLVSITDFNALIFEVVREQPVPFVYLRVGEKYRNYMIDEFQDTSIMQWQNLLPLFENSLADNRLNMIVGDAKQAIYRFKNGDAEQFVILPEIKNPTADPFLEDRERLLIQHFNGQKLATNYRSRKEIVEFNNSFFKYAAPRFLEENASIYEDVEQNHKRDYEGGLVKFDFVEQDFIINKVLEIVSDTKGAGYEYGDIAVLCRTNKDAVNIAEALIKERIKVVSNESLLLKNSLEVNFLVNWIYFLSNPGEKVSMHGIMECLFIYYPGVVDMNTYLGVNKESFYLFLDQAGIQIKEDSFAGLSFYDSVEKIVRVFKLDEKNPIYIRFFLDEVLNFSQKESSGPSGFIKYWEEKKHSLSVSISEDKDAVQILTVHKSKGLDFPVVIYAYPDQKDHNDIDWATVHIDSFTGETIDIPLVFPLSKAKTSDTNLEYRYKEEKIKTRLDKFNLYYVAFTRASERLHVVLEEQENKKDELDNLTQLVRKYLDENNLECIFGTGTTVQGKYKHLIEDNLETEISLDFLTSDWQDQILLAKRSPEEWSVGVSKTDYGKLMHLVLSRINTIDDFITAINEINAEYADHDDLEKANMIKSLTSLSTMKGIDTFFNGGKVICEREILTAGGHSYRPDRVICYDNATYILDYKTGKPNEKYNQQLKTYMDLLREMGYPDPRGYILFVNETPELVEVTSSITL